MPTSEEKITKIDIPNLIWVFSGRLDQVFDSATWLEPTRELRCLGWRVNLISAGPNGIHSIQGVEVLCISTIDLYFFRHVIFNLRLIGLLLRKLFSIDFILFHQSSAPWILPLKVLRLLNGATQPLFVMDTRTVLMEDLSKGTWRDRLRGWYYIITSRMANTWADGQTANTRRMAEYIGVPPERLWGIWPAGANTEKFTTARLNRNWPLDGDTIQLTYIGVVNYERNLLSLCQAIEKANVKGMRFALTITGDGTEREDLNKFAANTEGRIRIITPVPHDQIPYLLAKAHIGAIPFPDQEKFRVGSPIKLFEYMAAGLPLLATRIVCHTDVIGEGAYVFWAENGSVDALLAALRAIWERKSELKAMGQQASEAAENYTWHASAVKLSSALKKHLNGDHDSIK